MTSTYTCGGITGTDSTLGCCGADNIYRSPTGIPYLYADSLCCANNAPGSGTAVVFDPAFQNCCGATSYDGGPATFSRSEDSTGVLFTYHLQGCCGNTQNGDGPTVYTYGQSGCCGGLPPFGGGGVIYDFNNGEFCCQDTIYTFTNFPNGCCDGVGPMDATQGCCADGVFTVTTEFCCNDLTQTFADFPNGCCGTTPIDATQGCCNDTPYTLATHECCGGTIVPIGSCCGGTTIFDPADEVCCDVETCMDTQEVFEIPSSSKMSKSSKMSRRILRMMGSSSSDVCPRSGSRGMMMKSSSLSR